MLPNIEGVRIITHNERSGVFEVIDPAMTCFTNCLQAKFRKHRLSERGTFTRIGSESICGCEWSVSIEGLYVKSFVAGSWY